MMGNNLDYSDITKDKKMVLDKLEIFKDWWLKERPFTIPHSNSITNVGNIHGVVLYRAECWQVQVFILEPFAIIPDHIHPNVDSYEVFLSGDIELSINGVIKNPRGLEASFTGSNVYYGTDFRILPNTWHGGNASSEGGSFLSIQQWLNGTIPTTVGDDWSGRAGEDRRIYNANS